MEATTAQTITFDRAYAESRFFARNIDAIKAQVSHDDYIWNERGQFLAAQSVMQAMRVQVVPTTPENIAAALAFVGEGK